MRTAPIALVLLLLGTAPAQTRLELGKMWTFENPPLAYLEEEYGFEPGPGWLEALRMASLRFGNGCSASFVSPRGLIMTNHHCVRDRVAEVSPDGEDWVADGFYASSLEGEVPIPGLTVQQLVSMRDVTDAVNEGIGDEDDETAVQDARRRNRQGVLARAREEHPDLQPQIVRLHQGAVFQLYLYRIWDDIRLVCVPHLQVAHFGGDPDNFTYPRYCLDFAFCRAYEDGEPADTGAHYFRWSETGAQEGDLVFVTGNPGSTARLQTMAQLEYLRDAYYPMVRQLIDNRLQIMSEFVLRGDGPEKMLRTAILTFQNADKAFAGYHEALLDPHLMAEKGANERDLRDAVLADPDLRRRFGGVWTELAAVAALQTELEGQRRFHAPGGSKHLARALEMVRAYTDPAARDDHVAHASGLDTTMSDYERALFVDHLERARDWLPPDDPYLLAVLGERSPEETARLLETSDVESTEWVQTTIEKGPEAVLDSGDPALRMAREIAPLIRAQEAAWEWIADREEALAAKIGRAAFEVWGDRISPDATFTLRFSDGIVAGYPFNGTIAPWRTCFYGMYGRHTVFGGEHPFDLPEIWLQRRDRIDMSRSVDLVSSNDIIGGNSGSPLVDRELRVVGLVFDGNIEMLANRFLYDDEVTRAVSVHVHGIEEALAEIYDADRILEELRGR